MKRHYRAATGIKLLDAAGRSVLAVTYLVVFSLADKKAMAKQHPELRWVEWAEGEPEPRPERPRKC